MKLKCLLSFIRKSKKVKKNITIKNNKNNFFKTIVFNKYII